MTNLDSSSVTQLITDKCTIGKTEVMYGWPPGQEVQVIFDVNFDTGSDMDVSNEFFRVSCDTEICDSSETTCVTSVSAATSLFGFYCYKTVSKLIDTISS